MTRTVWSPRLPFTVLDADAGLGGRRVARRDAILPDTGAWIAAVWLADRASAFAPASFLQAAQTNCGITAVREIVSTVALSPQMIGGGLFDLDGNLMALILPCDDRIAAIATGSVERMIALARTVQERILARHGLLIGPLSQDERRYFTDVNGLLVREVWAPAAGGDAILPGDIVTAVNGHPVTSMDDLRPLADTDGPFELGVRRGTTTRKLTVAPGSSGQAAPGGADTGIDFDSPARGLRIDALQPAARMARAGIRAGDRLVRINGAEPRSVRQAQRALATSSGPMLIDVEREGRRLAIVVP
jgi:S1-C subfamily serine protease